MTSVFIILLFQWIPAVFAQSCSAPYTQSHFKLEGHVMKTSLASARKECYDQCVLKDGCHSSNFYQDKRVCELNSANHLTNPESLVFSSDSEYVNNGGRPPAKCSNKLCSKPLECVIVQGTSDYKCVTCKDVGGTTALFFPEKTITDKVVVDNPSTLSAFTLSVWLHIEKRATRSQALFTYVTMDEPKFDEMQLYFMDDQVSFVFHRKTININESYYDSKWHHFDITWENTSGQVKIYVNGTLKKSAQNINVQHNIKSGAMILGQDADEYKGGYDARQSFQGKLTLFNMWDYVLPEANISRFSSTCLSTVDGNFFKWSYLKGMGEGKVTEVCARECV